ncbi:hypothetical protein FVEG_16535 [Fusarium verticillioides 7600]|uniref:Uncharacterized protein n=1 Tax=Gibberella moniliformis (strain M3125 / FGSC 7600) TaxID=334819 RepID=W7MZH6_GIBM7|nr:hypothetical protein FVEG_16535 [Fusarium verticillioides 7600]EWG49802.1 hypothetical protein FVEG_16535 [Fusarium verticillioides 7600]
MTMVEFVSSTKIWPRRPSDSHPKSALRFHLSPTSSQSVSVSSLTYALAVIIAKFKTVSLSLMSGEDTWSIVHADASSTAAYPLCRDSATIGSTTDGLRSTRR